MFELLLSMAKAAELWRAQGAKAVPKAERDQWIAQYFSVLADGFAAHLAQAPPVSSPLPKKRGRPKQDASKNLLDALLKRAEQVLAFLDDLSVPFTNDLVAYCTPSAWLACLLIFANILLGSMLIGWRKDCNPVIIGPIHGDQTCPSPIHERLPGHPIGFGGFVGSHQTAFA